VQRAISRCLVDKQHFVGVFGGPIPQTAATLSSVFGS
jgi:hypothetical protein